MDEAAPNRFESGMRTWTPLIAPWLVPVAIAILGWQINSTIAETQTSADYVRLSVEILSDERPSVPGDAALIDGALRSWAVDVFSANSPIPLDPDLEAALRQGELVFGRSQAAAGLDGPLPEGQCTLITAFSADVHSEAAPLGEPVAKLESGSPHGAFELRTYVWTQEQFVRVEEGWVLFVPLFTLLDCGEYDPRSPPTTAG